MEGETGRGKRNENHHVIHDVQVVGATNMAAFRSQYPYLWKHVWGAPQTIKPLGMNKRDKE